MGISQLTSYKKCLKKLRKVHKKIAKLENDVHQALAVMDKETGKMLNYRNLIRLPKYKEIWSRSSANEFGRLVNGVGGRIKNPTNTIKFIMEHEVPKQRKKDVTYGQFVCTIRPEKKENERTRFTVGGDRINYPGEVATPTADMLVTKMLMNSVISTKGVRFMMMDISNFYLMTSLKRPEYIKINITDIPEEITISAIASQSSKPTEDTMKQTQQLLKYLASQEEAVLTYNASDMILAAHSDASYLSEPQARSRAGGHFFLSNNSNIPPNNGAILNIAHIIKHVMTSATEAELAGLYIMAREAVYMRIILEELGHKQPPTPLQTDNSMADGVVNGKIQPKRTKAMDMRFHWLRDRECQEQFRIYWRPGKLNYADYWTKHHAAKHHKNVRKEFLTPHIVVEMLRQSAAAA